MSYWRYNEEKNVIERVETDEDGEIASTNTVTPPYARDDAASRLRRWSEENKLT